MIIPKMRALLSLLLIFAATLPTAARAADRALLVGVGAYENLSAAQQLLGPPNDLKLMRGLLTQTLGYTDDQIKALGDADATKSSVIAAIRDWLLDGTQSGDRVFFYFSGHGVQLTDLNDDEEDGRDEALAMYDVRPGVGGYENVLLDDEIEQLFAEVSDRFVTMIVDACHSGTATRSITPSVQISGTRFLPFIGRTPPRAGTRALSFERVIVDEPKTPIVSFSAAAPYQLAFEDHRKPEAERHGVFTGAYVAGLGEGKADQNKNGKVSFSELLAYVRQESTAYCGQREDCLALTPMMEAPDLAYQYDVAPRFTTAKPDKPTAEVDFNPPQDRFTTAPEPVPDEDKPALGNLVTYSSYPEDSYEHITDTVGYTPNEGVSISLKPMRLRTGEPFRILLNSDVSGQLVLYDISDNGEAVQLFPNEFARKNTSITAHNTFFFPDYDYGFDLDAGDSGGTLVAFVVEHDFDINALAPEKYGLKETLSAEATLGALVNLLSGHIVVPAQGGVTTRAVNWAYGATKYSVH